MNERLKTHSKTQKKSADLVSNKLRIGVFQRYQMKCKSVSKKSPRYINERDQPVGFMLLSGQHMDALFIDPDVRGCGVGRMLVEHALSMAPELTTNVNEQNEQAVGFYKKVGFKVTGRSEVDDLGKPYPLLNLAYVGE